MSGCSPCCITFNCGGDPNPTSLDFQLSIAGSCPGGGRITVSGTLTRVAGPSCADLIASGDCSGSCGCQYLWAETSPPDCGAYAANIGLTCTCYPNDFFLQTPCDHIPASFSNYRMRCGWEVGIDVYRTDLLVEAIAIPCFVGDDDVVTCFDRIQSCEDCTWSTGDPHTDGTARAYCCCTCSRCNSTCNSPCGSGSQGDAHGCPLPDPPPPGVCCTTEDCSGEYRPLQCRDPDTHVEVQCGPPTVGPCTDSCGTTIGSRRYRWVFGGCNDPDNDGKGCNPVGCPPNSKNTGDFFINVTHSPTFDFMGNYLGAISNCPGDWIKIGCSGSLGVTMAQTFTPCKPVPGVGTTLGGILAELGIREVAGCDCERLKTDMNALGPEGCEREIDSLSNRLRLNSQKYGIVDKARAAFGALKSGLAFSLNPLDPFRDLVRLAIAKHKETSSTK